MVKNKKNFELYRSLAGKSVSSKVFCSQNKVEEFNEFFSNIGKKMNAEFLTRTTVTIENQSESMFLKSISENDVMYAINNCKNKFSLDCYNLNYFFIEKVSDCLAAPLQLLFNRCIELEQYPESLKITKVIPFFKNGNKDDPSKFRPISLLAIIGKVFERIIFDRIQNYLNVFEILSDSQFGFRHGKSTVDAIATLIEEIRSNLHNNSQKNIRTFLDLTRAFDTVDHNILLQKCYRYGLRGPIYTILKSYLFKRMQYTLIGDKKSKLNLIELGVPQGSILGPLLFIIYMNDLSLSQKKSNVILYADDTVVKSRSSASKIDDDHNRALDKVNDWLIKNKLTLNKEKTKSIIL